MTPEDHAATERVREYADWLLTPGRQSPYRGLAYQTKASDLRRLLALADRPAPVGEDMLDLLKIVHAALPHSELGTVGPRERVREAYERLSNPATRERALEAAAAEITDRLGPHIAIAPTPRFVAYVRQTARLVIEAFEREMGR